MEYKDHLRHESEKLRNALRGKRLSFVAHAEYDEFDVFNDDVCYIHSSDILAQRIRDLIQARILEIEKELNED